jgi:hypothetical protein
MRLSAAMTWTVLVPLGVFLALGAVACVDSLDNDGKVLGLQGGSTLDSAIGLMQQQPPSPALACTESGKAGKPCTVASTCCGVSAGTGICAFNGAANGTCQKEPPLGTGHTWTELYADYFGGTGRTACAGNGMCHGTMAGLGFVASQYQCPPDDKDACYAGITSSSAALITPGQAFEDDFLYQAIRKQQSVGLNNMPLNPTEVYTFTEKDLGRISAWIMAGAPND